MNNVKYNMKQNLQYIKIEDIKIEDIGRYSTRSMESSTSTCHDFTS